MYVRLSSSADISWDRFTIAAYCLFGSCNKYSCVVCEALVLALKMLFIFCVSHVYSTYHWNGSRKLQMSNNWVDSWRFLQLMFANTASATNLSRMCWNLMMKSTTRVEGYSMQCMSWDTLSQSLWLELEPISFLFTYFPYNLMHHCWIWLILNWSIIPKQYSTLTTLVVAYTTVES